jgi:alkylated DNA repair dioxygenase AlkB
MMAAVRSLDLFSEAVDPTRNLLPADGEVYDHSVVFGADEAHAIGAALDNDVPWRHDELVMAGKHIVTAREVAWCGDVGASYRYSGATKEPSPWTPLLSSLKTKVEGIVGVDFNAALLNRYADGRQGMSWHSDDEAALGPTPTIASLSFGCTRRFVLRHRLTREKVSLDLVDGQLLVMAGVTQRHWQHALMKSARAHTRRINITFRTVMT